MAYIGMTGQGATAVLSTTGAVGCVRSIQLPEWTQEKIDASCLSTTGFKQYIPGDLTEPGEVSMVMVFDPEIAVPTPGVIEDLLVTFPLGTPTNTTAATLSGSGFLSSVGQPNMTIDGLLELNLTFCFDGDAATPPTFTVEAA